MRQFIRHPVNIPIEANCESSRERITSPRTRNVGVGGLAFVTNEIFDPGSLLRLRISHIGSDLEIRGRVVWAKILEQGVELGVEFLDQQDAFQARMLEQICQIEAYKEQVRKREGRALSSQEAAEEWVAKYAADFPGASQD